MTEEPFFYTFCWNCDNKLNEDGNESVQTCPKCKMPQFTKEGDEIGDKEMYDNAKQEGLL